MGCNPSPSPNPPPDPDLSDSWIQSLDTYCLQSIFDLNTNIDDERPLETARHTSQVCSLWREHMLTSPKIWGQILKISELQIDKDDSPWRDLVLERTGTAPLFFKGKIHDSRLEWFLNLISPHWGRIHCLDVPPTESGPRYTGSNAGFIDAPSPCVVFNFPRVVINLKAPWVPNLRVINLAVSCSTTEILECLASMPHLERAMLSMWLSDDTLADDEPLLDSEIISLPYLTELHIGNYYTLAADVIRRLTTNIECKYTFATREDTVPGAEQLEIFSRCFQRPINLRNEHKLTVYVSDECVSITLGPDLKNYAYMHTHNHSCTDFSMFEQEDFLTYMSRFYCGDSSFDKITELDFFIEVTGEEVIKYIFQSIVDFLLKFPSVTTLKVLQQSLFLITEIYVCDGQIANERLFPSLEKLEFGYDWETINFPVHTLLPKFLDQRRSYGRPIKHLSLGEDITKLNLHFGFLNEFDGMEVKFQLVFQDGMYTWATYLCGAGEPDELDFTHWKERFFGDKV